MRVCIHGLMYKKAYTTENVSKQCACPGCDVMDGNYIVTVRRCIHGLFGAFNKFQRSGEIMATARRPHWKSWFILEKSSPFMAFYGLKSAW